MKSERQSERRVLLLAAECDILAKMQRVTMQKQPLLAHVVNSAMAKYDIAGNTVFMCWGAGIPPEKLNHPLFRKWLQKYTDINGCIPTLCGNFPKVNIIRLNDGMQSAIMRLLNGRPVSVFFDEWTDSRRIATLAVLVRSFKVNMWIDVTCPIILPCS